MDEILRKNELSQTNVESWQGASGLTYGRLAKYYHAKILQKNEKIYFFVGFGRLYDPIGKW
jgi:hypothetical protein